MEVMEGEDVTWDGAQKLCESVNKTLLPSLNLTINLKANTTYWIGIYTPSIIQQVQTTGLFKENKLYQLVCSMTY